MFDLSFCILFLATSLVGIFFEGVVMLHVHTLFVMKFCRFGMEVMEKAVVYTHTHLFVFLQK